ncbi:conserved hypothetical protein [Cenarchaeum symbiosum A]|uniref:C2H2-type domain-containing protein n=1 Tax=Cenarchaeum symbiosum (strain A) TaxID=414004 RepID=A0RUN3_CENSY|nr:conserved hypothetical protein [Cenarchaeum symbiosum A]
MGLFGKGKKKDENKTKCDVCGNELYYPERLERHMKKAHGNVPEKKMDPKESSDGMW